MTLNQFELHDYWERLSWLLAYYWDGNAAEIAKAAKTTKPAIERELADVATLPSATCAKLLAKAAGVDWEWLSSGVGRLPSLRPSKLPAFCYIGCQTSADEGYEHCDYAYITVDLAFIQKCLQRMQRVASDDAGDLQYHVYTDYCVTFTPDLHYTGLEEAPATALYKLLAHSDISGEWFLLPPGWEPTDDAQPEASRADVSHCYADATHVFFEILPHNSGGTVDTHRLNQLRLLWLANSLKDRDTAAQSLTASIPVRPSLVGVLPLTKE